jgi:hypothetical protein
MSPLIGRAAIAEHYRQLFKQLPAVTGSLKQRILVGTLRRTASHSGIAIDHQRGRRWSDPAGLDRPITEAKETSSSLL